MGKSDDTFFTRIVRVHAIAQKEAVDLLFECGVSPFEQWLLESIPDDGRACASALAEELAVPTSTVTRALRRMEQHGYLVLTKGHFYDARVLRAKLTELGIMVRNNAIGFERDLDIQLLDGLPRNALAGLLQGLLHIERRARVEGGSGRRPAEDEDASSL